MFLGKEVCKNSLWEFLVLGKDQPNIAKTELSED